MSAPRRSAISKLDHPNICTLFDTGQHEGTSYLVMQYLDGETLADRLQRGPLPLDQAWVSQRRSLTLQQPHIAPVSSIGISSPAM